MFSGTGISLFLISIVPLCLRRSIANNIEYEQINKTSTPPKNFIKCFKVLLIGLFASVVEFSLANNGVCLLLSILNEKKKYKYLFIKLYRLITKSIKLHYLIHLQIAINIVYSYTNLNTCWLDNTTYSKITDVATTFTFSLTVITISGKGTWNGTVWSGIPRHASFENKINQILTKLNYSFLWKWKSLSFFTNNFPSPQIHFKWMWHIIYVFFSQRILTCANFCCMVPNVSITTPIVSNPTIYQS